jgi:long-chain acyl-CoA synthetase
LIVPDFEAVSTCTSTVAGTSESLEEIVALPNVVRLFADVVEKVNTSLANYEQVKRWTILPTEFSIATGELTPTLKVKRRVVAERWGAAIEELYTASK